MARHTEHNTSKIYPVAEVFLANCLMRDGSLLFEDSFVWRLDVLDQIHTVFVATPDEGRPVLHRLFPSNVGACASGRS
jgi:5-methylcytosine-specific restriction protein B